MYTVACVLLVCLYMDGCPSGLGLVAKDKPTCIVGFLVRVYVSVCEFQPSFEHKYYPKFCIASCTVDVCTRTRTPGGRTYYSLNL